ncbi:DUF692 family multinuclear iron-containing protein [Nitrospira moscoviensis]|uniref:Uncharacterized protein n=1 Tax=Nitrospira moscoviensis TaxID=42253 RepID=A0A0K2GJ49_NITMO|nr:DUF692 family multinuclear iron-containing protein [Nitrospira moscoviensis]ALA60662.1 hypothetical protein NITMOv2_4285 [Nitrospira moscoviensis]
MPNGTPQAEFYRRLAGIATHGLGLSVDVYQPDLRSLLAALRGRQVPPGYLEVFRATPAALAAVRTEAACPLAYHGEGLWLTQPEALDDRLFRDAVREVAGHLDILQAAWLNHECATKHMAGYSFGTYLPPVYTEASATVVAENASFIQAGLDRWCRPADGGAPLLLLEMPPLTCFVAGTLPIPAFFRLVAERTACGLVLDIGHLWTVYRYSGAAQRFSLAQFVDDFLDEFPLERVVEMHVAGLAVHSSTTDRSAGAASGCLPPWIDAHAAPIPAVLFDMLDQVLGHPRLGSLKGLALEVDTKPMDLIVEEYETFTRRYAGIFRTPTTKPAVSSVCETSSPGPSSGEARRELGRAYERYAHIAAGHAEPEGREWTGPAAWTQDLEMYRTGYLPYEILHWGGDLEAMFPESCRQLAARGVPQAAFVGFWFRAPRPLTRTYDFFLLKIERFVEFVRDRAPELEAAAMREAEELRRAYDLANEPVFTDDCEGP